MNWKFRAIAIACVFFTLAMLSPQRGNATDYGKPGEPIHLVVAHPCCYAEVWSVFANTGKQFWKKYLPAGSTVEYLVGLQGAVVVNQMLAGKADVGYMGDLPAFTATTKNQVADVRIVASTAMSYDQCYVFVVRKDAPEFADSTEALKWVNGKTVSTPKGSCTDDFVQKLFKMTGTEPATYLSQNIEVIGSAFKSGRLDAAAVWEPNASNLVQEGLARRVASGKTIDQKGGGFVVMQADLIKQRPDIVKAWLEAELDAQIWMSNPANAKEMIDIVKSQVTGFSDQGLYDAIYGSYPSKEGGSNVRLYFPYAITPEVDALIGRGVLFLKSNKVINVDKLREDAVDSSFANEILKERKLTSPVGEVKAQTVN